MRTSRSRYVDSSSAVASSLVASTWWGGGWKKRLRTSIPVTPPLVHWLMSGACSHANFKFYKRREHCPWAAMQDSRRSRNDRHLSQNFSHHSCDLALQLTNNSWIKLIDFWFYVTPQKNHVNSVKFVFKMSVLKLRKIYIQIHNV